MALQACCRVGQGQGDAAAAAAAATAAAAAQNATGSAARLLLPLRLQSFHTAQVPTPALLRALAGVGLQQLVVHDDYAWTCWQPDLLAALADLTSLRALSHTAFDSAEVIEVLPVMQGMLPAVGHLSHLTHLCIDVLVSALQVGELHHLPQFLRSLDAAFVAGPAGDGGVGSAASVADLSRLTALQQLTWRSMACLHLDAPSLQATLPASLSELTAGSPLPQLFTTESSTHMQKLSVLVAQLVCDADVVVFGDLLSAAKPAAVQLFLEIAQPIAYKYLIVWTKELTAAGLQRAAGLVGSTSSITSFALEATQLLCQDAREEQIQASHGRDVDFLLKVEWCKQLSKLPDLQSLHFTGQRRRLPLKREDLLHLTAFTSLTALSLVCGWNEGLDDVCAVSLAMHLTRLQHLELSCTSINSVSLLPVVAGRLKGLRSL